jgi:hypothetical protein
VKTYAHLKILHGVTAMRAKQAHIELISIKLFESRKYLAVSLIRENRHFFDNGEGPKMAALSISEKKWLH